MGMEEPEPGTIVKEETEADARLAPRWHVILLDDNDHSYEYVIEMLQAVFAKSAQDAFAHAKEVDASGRTILLTTSKEHAELKQDQIHSYGPDFRIPRCAGSMSADIEPAD
jgi:ATP-dependent Clp protease adaptor protein ClpS